MAGRFSAAARLALAAAFLFLVFIVARPAAAQSRDDGELGETEWLHQLSRTFSALAEEDEGISVESVELALNANDDSDATTQETDEDGTAELGSSYTPFTRWWDNSILLKVVQGKALSATESTTQENLQWKVSDVARYYELSDFFDEEDSERRTSLTVNEPAYPGTFGEFLEVITLNSPEGTGLN